MIQPAIDYLQEELHKLKHYAQFPQDKYKDKKHQIKELIGISENSERLVKSYEKAIDILNDNNE